MTFKVVRISSKGQLVIPQEIRDRMQIKEGDNFIIFTVSDDVLVLRKIVFSDENYKTFKKKFIEALKELNVEISEDLLDKAFVLMIKKCINESDNA
jgi:AbrB family looped-hinge helix DNA binding protein